MKGKQLGILLLALAVLGGAWYLLSERTRAAWSGDGGGNVVKFEINDVSHVLIKNPSGEVNVVKKGDEWTVAERADYPASFEQVSGLVRKLWELKAVQDVKVGPSQLPRLELVEPGKGDKAGTLVQFTTADSKPISAVLLGKKYIRKMDGGGMEMGDMGGIPAGRYVKPVESQKVSLVSDSLDEADPKPERWLLKDFIKVETPKTITLAGATDAQRWSITRDSATAEWKLADAKPEEKVDAGKASPLNGAFSAPSFNDVLASDAKPADTGLDKPTTATIDTFDGFHYELNIGKANGENYPVQVKVSASLPKERTPGKDEKPEDKTRLDSEFTAKQKTLEEKLAKEKKFEGRAYLVAKYVVDPLLKDRSALLADKPAEPAKPAESGATTTAPAPVAPAFPSAPVTVTTPPMTAPAPAPKVEAVTPPVQAPPAPAAPQPQTAAPAVPAAPAAPEAPKPAATETVPASPAAPAPAPAPVPAAPAPASSEATPAPNPPTPPTPASAPAPAAPAPSPATPEAAPAPAAPPAPANASGSQTPPAPSAPSAPPAPSAPAPAPEAPAAPAAPAAPKPAPAPAESAAPASPAPEVPKPAEAPAANPPAAESAPAAPSQP